ncbi:MAG: hypothetical protein GPI96_21325 [Microcystis aeruginosa BS13-02]|jgi:hypothetical protein|uniref:Uncharacterized protein n=1 Tax=Microcystis aeruginosa Ma_MB_S_20031200_S102 TaxID=2486254 RepID=A0A552EWA1_MICAE|nr:hypothetical protein [Microcystis aeruginosa BS13-02]TRU24867.1 MAG: hypothetical protein EWV79_09130 [Microcystis aeruginosa Ma_MB_S_20031200_S102D]TRU38741.1 MAG: hypothetical protein EWV92_07875 [Microcystis aeruginosa Ma_MB_S_20031200_S102]
MELDNIIKKVAGAYLASAIIAVIVLIVTLGQPFVVFLSIGAMGLVTVLGDAIAEYGIEAVLNSFYTERSKKESLETLLAEIDTLPLTDDLKLKTKKHLTDHQEQTVKQQETVTEPTPENPQTVVIENEPVIEVENV